MPGSGYLHPVAQTRQKKESSVSSPTALSPFFHRPLSLLTHPPHTTYPPPSHYLPSPVPLCCSFLNPPSPVFYLFFRTGCSSLPLLLPVSAEVNLLVSSLASLFCGRKPSPPPPPSLFTSCFFAEKFQPYVESPSSLLLSAHSAVGVRVDWPESASLNLSSLT